MILLIAQNKSVTECWQQVFKMAAFALDAQPGPFQRTYRKGGGVPDHRDGACSYSERQFNVARQPLCLHVTLPAGGYRQAQFSNSKSLSFVTVASRIHVGVTFLTRYDVTSLIMRL